MTMPHVGGTTAQARRSRHSPLLRAVASVMSLKAIHPRLGMLPLPRAPPTNPDALCGVSGKLAKCNRICIAWADVPFITVTAKRFHPLKEIG